MVQEEDNAARLEDREAFLRKEQGVLDVVEGLEARKKIDAIFPHDIGGEETLADGGPDRRRRLGNGVGAGFYSHDVLDAQCKSRLEHEAIAAADIKICPGMWCMQETHGATEIACICALDVDLLRTVIEFACRIESAQLHRINELSGIDQPTLLAAENRMVDAVGPPASGENSGVEIRISEIARIQFHRMIIGVAKDAEGLGHVN